MEPAAGRLQVPELDPQRLAVGEDQALVLGPGDAEVGVRGLADAVDGTAEDSDSTSAICVFTRRRSLRENEYKFQSTSNCFSRFG